MLDGRKSYMQNGVESLFVKPPHEWIEITNSLDSKIWFKGVSNESRDTHRNAGYTVYVVLPRFERFASREDKARSGSRMGQGIWETRHHWVRSSSWIFVAPLGPWFFIACEPGVYQGADFVALFIGCCFFLNFLPVRLDLKR